VVIGSRYKKESQMKKRPPLYRVLWSRFANRVVQRAILPRIMDTQCGFKAFTREASRKLFSLARRDGWGFDLEILSLAKKYGLVIHEVPIEWTDDPRSRIHPIRDALKITWEFIKIKWDLMRNAH
jgi:dolichyl-phosphate beta-glucosyltransferase